VICFAGVRFLNHEIKFMRKFGNAVYNRENGLYNRILLSVNVQYKSEQN